MPCGCLVDGTANAKTLRKEYVYYVQGTAFRSVWLGLSEQGRRSERWRDTDVVGPTKSKVETLATVRWEAIG